MASNYPLLELHVKRYDAYHKTIITCDKIGDISRYIIEDSTEETMCTSTERTAGTIEAWNLIQKRNDHIMHKMRPDLFIKEHFKVLIGRQLTYIDHLSLKGKTKVQVYYF